MRRTSLERRRLSEPDLDVLIVLGVDRVDETDLMWHGRHHESMGSRPVAEETDTPEEGSVRHSRRREDDALAGGEVFGVVDALDVGDAHALEPLAIGFLGQDELGLDLAVE